MSIADPGEIPFPTMAGVTFRRLERPADDSAISALLNAALAADDLPHRISAAQIGSWLDNPSRMDPAKDWLMAEADGRLIGYCEGGWEQDNDGGRNYGVWAHIDPSWRRRGLGTLLLRWNEARQRALAASHPPEVGKRLESWSHEAEGGRLALLEANGYSVARYEFEMERDNLDEIPDFPFPDGVELRPATEEHLRANFELEVAVFRDHWGAIDDSEAAFQRMRTDPRRNPALWVVGWHGDEIVAQSLNRIDPDANADLGLLRGWVNSVGVRREWRRQGLGRAIVAASLRVLRDAGMTSAALGVDAENPHGALGVYASCGFKVASRGRVYRKPLEQSPPG